MSEKATVADLMTAYIKIRDKRDELRDKEKELNAKLEVIEGHFKKIMEASGLDRLPVNGYVAYPSVLTSVKTFDAAQFMQHIRETQNFDLLETRPAKAAVLAYEAQGVAVPGVSIQRIERINVKKG